MQLAFLGACNEVGKSSFWLKGNDVRLLLDAGIKIHDSNEIPPFSKHACDAAIITHAHLDHSGGAPALYRYGNPVAFCTYPTEPIVNLLLDDSEKVALDRKKSLPFSGEHRKRMDRKTSCLAYGQEYEFHDGTKFQLIDAGHIPGSSQVLVESKNKTLLYTGDFNLTETRLHYAAKPPAEEVDALIIESTYGLREHPPRKKLEEDFCSDVRAALENGKTALVPCFAVGRTQEMLQVLNANGFRNRVFVNGMGLKVNEIVSDFPSYVKDYSALKRALASVTQINSTRQAREAIGRPGIIVSTAGMLDGGPMLSYIKEADRKGRAAVFLTGYQVRGTNGRHLVEEGQIKAEGGKFHKINLQVKQYDFSAHAGKRDLHDYVKKVNPEKVFCVHGDDCRAFAAALRGEGFDAIAPEIGETAKI